MKRVDAPWTLSADDFDLATVENLRRGHSVAVIIPAKNEAATIGAVIDAVTHYEDFVDQLIVVNDHSSDDTHAVATHHGARVVDLEGATGKGEALRAGLALSQSELVVFLDADVLNPGADYVARMIQPLLERPEINLVKGFYERPLHQMPTGGGRVNELAARPILSLLYPGLGEIRQPLAGESAARRDTLAALGLDKTTDVIVTADHGFSVESRQSETSSAAKLRFPDVVPGFLPPGFPAIDLAAALGLNLYDTAGFPIELHKGFYPKRGGALLGTDPAKPLVTVVSNGGSDLIYLADPTDTALAGRVVEALTRQDYTGAIFAADALGPIPGTLPLSAIGMAGVALPPAPSLVVSFKSFSTGCPRPEVCGAEVADTDLQQGQGIHGSFGRQDTHNFMAAIGPDFKAGFVDPAPVGNSDIAPTIAKLLDLDLGGGGHAVGRVVSEALSADGAAAAARTHVLRSSPAANGFVTVLDWQDVGGVPYFDAAGMPGRTLGLVE